MSQFYTLPLGLEEEKEVASLFQKEGLVFVYPTASYYALGCKATDEKAVEKIYTIKGRQENKPLLVLVSGLEMFKDYTLKQSKAARELLQEYWPGPLTLVAGLTEKLDGPTGESKKPLAKNLNLTGPEVGFRQDTNRGAQGLIALAQVPLVGTSANKTGQVPKTKIEEVFAELGETVDLYFDGGETKGGDPSTVVRFDDNKLCILREGSLNLNS